MPRNYVSNKDETVRMFQNDFLESLSKVHWSVPLLLYIPVIASLIYVSLFTNTVELTRFLFLYTTGLILWTLTEYILHRFVFHYDLKSRIGKRIHFIFHGVHHDYPKDSKRLVMPPSVSLPLASIFYFLFEFIFGFINNLSLFAGFLTGYLAYDMIHYAIHHYNTKNKFWLSIKNHHMLHHYKDPNRGFGVSFPFWDYVWGTTVRKNELE